MEVGVVTLSPSLLFLIGLGGFTWAVLRYLVIPRCEQAELKSRGTDIIQSSARLRMYKGLLTIAISLVFAPAIVALIYVVAQIRIEASADDPAKVQKVVAARDVLERTLGQFTDIAIGTWVAALVILGAIWLIARKSASRRRWKKALDARRKAYSASLATESLDGLLMAAEAANSERFLCMKAEVERISKVNMEQIEALETARVLQLPRDDGTKMTTSVAELRTTIAHFELEAAQLESDKPTGA